jgi:hypothetical protein
VVDRIGCEEHDMSITSIGPGVGSVPTSASSASAQLRTSFTQLQNNIAAGNLTGAQQAYTALVQAYQGVSGGQMGGAVVQDLAALGTALQSGDLGSATTALGTLTQDFQALSQGGSTVSDTGAASDASPALTPAELTSALVSIFASGGDPSAAGADPLLAALGGSNASLGQSSDALLTALNGGGSGSGVSDPLLAALNGTSAPESTSTDPLLQALNSGGVNLVV